MQNMREWQEQFKRTSSAILMLTQVPLHIGRLVRILSTDLLVLLELEEAAQQYLVGMQALSEGYLPLTLISPEVLTNTLTTTAARLRSLYPGHEICFPQAYHCYREPMVVTANSGDNLYIQVTIPIDTSEPILDIYKVYSTPMPVHNDTGATKVIELPHYFAAQVSNDWYQELSHTDFESCIGTGFKDCPQTFTLRHWQNPTCTSALYFKKKDHIEQYCKTVFLPYHKFADNAHD